MHSTLSIVANNDYAEKARSVHALDPGHLNVRRRTRARYKCCKAGWLSASRKVFGQRLYNLAGTENAKVEIRQQGNHAPAFGLFVMQNNRARVGNTRRCTLSRQLAILFL